MNYDAAEIINKFFIYFNFITLLFPKNILLSLIEYFKHKPIFDINNSIIHYILIKLN